MLFEVASLLVQNYFLKWALPLLLFRTKQWRNSCGSNCDIDRQRSSAELGRAGPRIGEYHGRSLKALGSVDRHHADLVRRLSGIALHVDRSTGEPCNEAIERCCFVALEIQGAVQELV